MLIYVLSEIVRSGRERVPLSLCPFATAATNGLPADLCTETRWAKGEREAPGKARSHGDQLAASLSFAPLYHSAKVHAEESLSRFSGAAPASRRESAAIEPNKTHPAKSFRMRTSISAQNTGLKVPQNEHLQKRGRGGGDYVAFGRRRGPALRRCQPKTGSDSGLCSLQIGLR